jgi:hypothetical protein
MAVTERPALRGFAWLFLVGVFPRSRFAGLRGALAGGDSAFFLFSSWYDSFAEDDDKAVAGRGRMRLGSLDILCEGRGRVEGVDSWTLVDEFTTEEWGWIEAGMIGMQFDEISCTILEGISA